MDAFVKATTFQYSAYLRTGNGDTWRVWFGGESGPWIEKCIPSQVAYEVGHALADGQRVWGEKE